jgi:BirA family biotin operon repressor/biotin-[acetyl-CoA-carboxylase] ligase
MFYSNKNSDSLDAQCMKQAISVKNSAMLNRIDIFQTINSTNTYLLECAAAGEKSGLFCFAEQQSKGKGRLGRQWLSPKGNLYFSLLWHFSQDQLTLSSLSLAIAVMVANALKKIGIGHGLELKWPNDILFNGKKMVGILLERSPATQHQVSIVIGVGINIIAPTELNHQATGLTDILTEPFSRNHLAGLIINELLTELPKFQQAGFAAFLTDWNTYDVLSNKACKLITQTNTLMGVVKGINLNGELLFLTDKNESMVFQCGEVSIRLPSHEQNL